MAVLEVDVSMTEDSIITAVCIISYSRDYPFFFALWGFGLEYLASFAGNVVGFPLISSEFVV